MTEYPAGSGCFAISALRRWRAGWSVPVISSRGTLCTCFARGGRWSRLAPCGRIGALVDERVQRARPLAQVGLLLQATHADGEQQIRSDDERPEQLAGDVGPADSAALVAPEVLADAVRFGVDDLPDGTFERGALAAAHEHADHVAIRPERLERVEIGARVDFEQLLVPRGALLHVAGSELPVPIDELLHGALALLLQGADGLVERPHQLAEQRFLRFEVEIEGPLRQAAGRR